MNAEVIHISLMVVGTVLKWLTVAYNASFGSFSQKCTLVKIQLKASAAQLLMVSAERTATNN